MTEISVTLRVPIKVRLQFYASNHSMDADRMRNEHANEPLIVALAQHYQFSADLAKDAADHNAALEHALWRIKERPGDQVD